MVQLFWVFLARGWGLGWVLYFSLSDGVYGVYITMGGCCVLVSMPVLMYVPRYIIREVT